ncbi:uncharacterized protein LOC126829402, partial [Patella vulgata]|uniref:uncharacterized protein LOC126829402 n=1 Tax=Patella vulgata TaxID=6465 RepID=UPI0024A86682
QSILFVSIIGIFAPTLFSNIYGDLECGRCELKNNTGYPGNSTSNYTQGFICEDCRQVTSGIDGDDTLYKKHLEPLIYACAIVLPLSYIVGLVFTLKTHSAHIYDAFNEQLKMSSTAHEDAAQWSRLKSTLILLFCAVLIALCADLVTNNLQPLLESTGVSEYFVGVTMLALVPELPEVVNGVQFALQNNVNLGIEIGGSTAIQVCLVQVPLLVLINLIYPLNFKLIFNDVHMYSVIFSVVVINYIFQDGKSDYFQGFIVLLIYLVILSMYYFTLTPDGVKC